MSGLSPPVADTTVMWRAEGQKIYMSRFIKDISWTQCYAVKTDQMLHDMVQVKIQHINTDFTKKPIVKNISLFDGRSIKMWLTWKTTR